MDIQSLTLTYLYDVLQFVHELVYAGFLSTLFLLQIGSGLERMKIKKVIELYDCLFCVGQFMYE